MAVEDITRVDDVIGRLKDLESMSVKVGILASSGGEILMIANVQEFGCDIEVTNKMRFFFLKNFGFWTNKKVIKIPERSFVRSSFDAKGEDVFSNGGDLLDQVIEGGLSAKSFYEILGQTAADAIRNFMINEVNSPANASLTIKNKGSSNPLVDTGRLANAVQYEIVGG